MKHLLMLLAVACSGYSVAEQPFEKAFLEEDAFPLTHEMFQKIETQEGALKTVIEGNRFRFTVPPMSPKPVQLDFSFPPIKESGSSRQIDIPIRFDAPPTLAAVAYLR